MMGSCCGGGGGKKGGDDDDKDGGGGSKKHSDTNSSNNSETQGTSTSASSSSAESKPPSPVANAQSSPSSSPMSWPKRETSIIESKSDKWFAQARDSSSAQESSGPNSDRQQVGSNQQDKNQAIQAPERKSPRSPLNYHYPKPNSLPPKEAATVRNRTSSKPEPPRSIILPRPRPKQGSSGASGGPQSTPPVPAKQRLSKSKEGVDRPILIVKAARSLVAQFKSAPRPKSARSYVTAKSTIELGTAKDEPNRPAAAQVKSKVESKPPPIQLELWVEKQNAPGKVPSDVSFFSLKESPSLESLTGKTNNGPTKDKQPDGGGGSPSK